MTQRVDGEHHRFVGSQRASLHDLTLQLRLHLFPCGRKAEGGNEKKARFSFRSSRQGRVKRITDWGIDRVSVRCNDRVVGWRRALVFRQRHVNITRLKADLVGDNTKKKLVQPKQKRICVK